jgi:DNA-directed RNA polymerase specialized sigma24 family protein
MRNTFSTDNQPENRRGMKKHYYTAGEIADIKGVSVQTVRNWFSRNKRDMGKLREVVRYCSG